MTTAPLQSARRAVSPYARRLARERGIALESLTGTGPAGRIIAADVAGFVPHTAEVLLRNTGLRTSALGATIQMETLQRLLAGFAEADTPFVLEDVTLRAAGCALDDVPGTSGLEGLPVALETMLGQRRGQIVFADIRKGSLAPLRLRRLAALEAAADQSGAPAALSLRLLQVGDIRPVLMPLLPGRVMRLVLAAGPASAECLLSFDADAVDEDAATEFLARFKSYLEVPLRLLA